MGSKKKTNLGRKRKQYGGVVKKLFPDVVPTITNESQISSNIGGNNELIRQPNYSEGLIKPFVLRGSRSQNDHRFSADSRNHQCTANAVVALAYNNILPFNSWDGNSVDNILDYGDGLYKISISFRNSMLNHSEDPNLMVIEVYPYFIINSITYTLGIRETETVQGHVGIVGGEGPYYHTLSDGLRHIFSNYESAIFTCGYLSTCINKSTSNFYIFDSHSRGADGRHIEYGGVACLLKFNNFVSLLNFLLQNYNGDALYTLVPIEVQIGCDHNITNGQRYFELTIYDTVTSEIFSPVSTVEMNSYLKSNSLPKKRKLNSKLSTVVRKVAPTQTDTPHHIGKMDKVCPHCEALFFPNENMSCCRKGTIIIPNNSEYPDLLKSLITDKHRSSNAYMRNIRRYNTLLAFGSTTMSLRENIRRGSPVVVISGQIYHSISNVDPSDPKFGSLYFIDSDEASRRREANVIYGGCDRTLLKELDAQLRHTHPFAQLYRNLGQAFEDVRRVRGDNTIPQLGLYFYTKPNTDRRVYAAPSNFNEIGAVFTSVDGNVPPTGYIRIKLCDNRDTKFVDIPKLSPIVDSICYPLIFPRGEYGWSINLFSLSGRRITKRQFDHFRLMSRANQFNPILLCGRLTQQYIVDKYVELEGDRLFYLRTNQVKLRAESYAGLQDCIARKRGAQATENEKIGKVVILPSSFVGSPRFMQQNYQDAMAIVAKFGRPSLFITFTCNPHWPEISENIGSKLLNVQDRPELIARVFDLKRREFFVDVCDNKIFGEVIAFVYVIEFQKRGLPHMHCLLTLADEDKPRNPDDVDRIICAELPAENTRLFNTIMASMIHGPCGSRDGSAPCMEDGKCSKAYPKSFSNSTVLDQGAAIYRRRDDGRSVSLIKNRVSFTIDNRDVVPYNPYLSSKYECHINVEIVQTVGSVKYVFKYINKGPDAAVFQVRDEIVFDEIKAFIDSRYISSGEAAWKLLALPFQGKSHSIFRLPIHLPGERTVHFVEGEEEDALKENKHSILEAYFLLNVNDPEARSYKYIEIPLYYCFNSKKNSWSKRQRRCKVIPRMYTISPKYVEKFHLRILLLHVAGPKSFEDLRTYNGITYSTFQEAARKRYLISSDDEWMRTLEHAALVNMPGCMRKMFAYLLCFCEIGDPMALWSTFKCYMCEDYRKKNFSEFESENYALRRIDTVLRHLGRTLKDFNLPEPHQNLDIDIDKEDDGNFIIEVANFSPDQLNSDQRSIFDQVIGAIDSKRPGYFYLQGSGGTGKTYLYNTILSYCERRSIPSFAVAFTGIAALLLRNGRTVHSLFKLPLDMNADSLSAITAQSKEAAELRTIRLIIWDEISMASYHVINAVDRLLQDVNNNFLPFGGICILLGGDVKQLLPVATGRVRQIELFFTNCASWVHFRVMNLKLNMRTDVGEVNFTNWLEQLGRGTINENWTDDTVCLPTYCLTTDVVKAIYGNIQNLTEEQLASRAILCPKNEHCYRLNEKILESFPGSIITILSADSIASGDEDEIINFPEEYLNSITPTGMPQHELKLKTGVPIILLRNLSLTDGLINGTRLIVLNVTDFLLTAKIVTGRFSGNTALIPKMDLTSSDKNIPFQLKRRQFPVKICFALTINKAQGQTFNHVGIYLESPVFSHGQLYVAFSRARNWDTVKVQVERAKGQGILLKKSSKIFTKNIVYQNILNSIERSTSS